MDLYIRWCGNLDSKLREIQAHMNQETKHNLVEHLAATNLQIQIQQLW